MSRLLGPWLSSPSHIKVLCDVRADAEALQVIYGVRVQGVVDVQVPHTPRGPALNAWSSCAPRRAMPPPARGPPPQSLAGAARGALEAAPADRLHLGRGAARSCPRAKH